MAFVSVTGVACAYHLWWQAAPSSPPLTAEIIGRMGTYTLRYLETMGVGVRALGGAADHLHLLAEAPPDWSPEKLDAEARRITARYLGETAGLTGFTWAKDEGRITTVSPAEVAPLTEYIQENEARHDAGKVIAFWEAADRDAETEGDEPLPAWLQSALQESKRKS